MSGPVDRMTASDQDYLVDRVGELQPTVFDPTVASPMEETDR